VFKLPEVFKFAFYHGLYRLIIALHTFSLAFVVTQVSNVTVLGSQVF